MPPRIPAQNCFLISAKHFIRSSFHSQQSLCHTTPRASLSQLTQKSIDPKLHDKPQFLLRSSVRREPVNHSKLPHIARRHLAAQKRRTLAINTTTLADKFNMEWPKITLFGDSITRRSTDVENGCWGSMIDYRVGTCFDLDTRGFEGYNTKWALELMPKLFPRSYLEKVEIFIPFFGHNDSWDKKVPMHVPVMDYEANMRAIIRYLTENGLEKKKIILITPTWYHHEDFAQFLKETGFPPLGKTYEEAKKYSDVVLKVANDESIDVVDFFSISAKHEPLKEMFCDGVHFSRLGAKMLFEQLMPIIERKVEASYKKPLVDLWYAVPIDQHPELKPMIEAYTASLKKQ